MARVHIANIIIHLFVGSGRVRLVSIAYRSGSCLGYTGAAHARSRSSLEALCEGLFLAHGTHCPCTCEGVGVR